MVAGDGERAPQKAVGDEGAVPVYGYELKDGTYPVAVDTSSSMFRIVDASLTVEDGDMSAEVTLGGKGYLKLYMGTGEQADAAGEEEYSTYRENDTGAYTYEIPVEALNMELECTGFSKKKKKWYDHQIFFEADTLPEEAWVEPAAVELEDGEYRIHVELSGGTGKASVASPAILRVEDHRAQAVIQWSSGNFDYMRVYGKQYFPVNKQGNSVFEIPVYRMDEPMQVMADTTAMSIPHEIAYALTFDSSSVTKVENGGFAGLAAGAAALAAAGIFALLYLKRKKRGGGQP